MELFLLLLDLQRLELEAEERRAAAFQEKLNIFEAKLKLMVAKEVEDDQAHAHENSVPPVVPREDAAPMAIVEDPSVLEHDDLKIDPMDCSSTASLSVQDIPARVVAAEPILVERDTTDLQQANLTLMPCAR